MKIGILGGGSIGLHLAVQLQMAGKEPVVICRQRLQAEEIRANGITYTRLDGSTKNVKVHATDIEETLAFDWVLLAVKQPQIGAVIPYLRRLAVNQSFSLICFQNGIGHEQALLEQLSEIPAYFAVTTEGAFKESLSAVRHTGQGTTWIGKWNAPVSGAPQLEELMGLFQQTELQVIPEDRVRERVWKKLIINACINPLTALLGLKNGELLDSPYTLDAMKMLFEEAKKVAELEDIKIDTQFMQEIVTVCRNTYGNKSSMLQDIEASRITEIQYINGAIERIAKKHGSTVSYHSLIVRLIQAKQQK